MCSAVPPNFTHGLRIYNTCLFYGLLCSPRSSYLDSSGCFYILVFHAPIYPLFILTFPPVVPIVAYIDRNCPLPTISYPVDIRRTDPYFLPSEFCILPFPFLIHECLFLSRDHVSFYRFSVILFVISVFMGEPPLHIALILSYSRLVLVIFCYSLHRIFSHLIVRPGIPIHYLSWFLDLLSRNFSLELI